MEQSITIYKKSDTEKKDVELYDQFAWLIKARDKHARGYNLDCLCMERADNGKIRISATDGNRLHTIKMVTPDCLASPSLKYNDKGQIIFRVTKMPNSIICFFDDCERTFPSIQKLLDMPFLMPVCSVELYGFNADDRNVNLSSTLRKFYRTIDGIKPDWNKGFLSVDQLKDLAYECHSWQIFCGEDHPVIEFVYDDDVITKIALFQPMQFTEKK